MTHPLSGYVHAPKDVAKCKRKKDPSGVLFNMMDHLMNHHGIEKDTQHPTGRSQEAQAERAKSKQCALEAGMSETRFQAISKPLFVVNKTSLCY